MNQAELKKILLEYLKSKKTRKSSFDFALKNLGISVVAN